MKLVNLSLVLIGSIPICCLLTTSPIRGQIVPDATLPQNSTVTTNGNASVITGGTRMDGNLFHSFEQFSIPTGGSAFFESIPEIRNILSRVTGGSISNIDGLLGAGGSANLFLLNPNGIIFGPNARLDIGGSFLASTGSSIVFEDGSQFGTANSTHPVLTISAPLGVQFGAGAGSIVNRSITPDRNGNAVGLRVTSGQTLALLGGEVSLEGGHLTAAQGRIELGSVAGNGMVGLASQQTGLALEYEEVQNFQNIELSSAASANASGPGGGDIRVRGAAVRLAEGASIISDTLADRDGGTIEISSEQFQLEDEAFVAARTVGSGRGGSLNISASESVELQGTTRLEIIQQFLSQQLDPLNLSNGLFALSIGDSEAAGAAGDIKIETGKLTLDAGAGALATTFGPGEGGTLTVTTPPTGSVELSGGSVLFTGTNGAGAAGDLEIETGQLTLRDAALISSSTFEDGSGGNLTVKTPPTGSVRVVGARTEDSAEISFSRTTSVLTTGLQTSSVGAGAAGNLTVNTGTLTVEKGASVSAVALEGGAGGQVRAIATDSVQLIGTSDDGIQQSGLFAFTETDAPGGSVTIKTGNLTIQDGAVVSAISFFGGRGGDVTVEATGSVLVTGTSSPTTPFPDGIVTSSFAPGGQAGDLTVKAGSVELVGTGKLQIVEEILGGIDASGSPLIGPTDLTSGLFTSSFGGGAGNLTIETEKLIVRNGGVAAASTFGDGRGGSLTVNASGGEVELIGGGLLTGTTGSQAAGDLTINTGRLNLQEGAVVTTATLGTGRGGNLTVNAESVNLEGISTETFDLPIFVELQVTPQGLQRAPLGPQQLPSSLLTLTFGEFSEEVLAGDLEINTNELRIGGGAAISTSTLGSGRGGNLTVNTSGGLVELTGEGTFEETLINIFALQFDPSDIRNGLFTSSFGTGRAGDLKIETGQLIARGGAAISASTFAEGAAGSMEILAPDGLVELTDSGFLTGNVFSSQESGDLTITTGRLIARDGSVVSTTTLSSGQGGNLTVNADSVELIGSSADGQVPSALLTLTFLDGQAGNLTVNAEKLIARDGGFAAASTFGPGTGGNLLVNVSESVEVKGGSPPGGQFPSGLRSDALVNQPGFLEGLLPIPSPGTGNPGELRINTGTLIVRDGAEVGVNAGQSANAGDINIDADVIAVIQNSSIRANAIEGQGGNINIETKGRFVDGDSSITAISQLGVQGVVQFNTPDVEPSQGLVDLPEQLLNPEELVALACQKDRGDAKNEFIITGRGGLPPRPGEPLSSETLVGFDRASSSSLESISESAATPAPPTEADSATLPPPARGWFVNDKGELVLTSEPLAAISQEPSLNKADCHGR